jgi:predicted nucleic acid-binding protein
MSGSELNVFLDTNAVIDLLKGTPGVEVFFHRHLDGRALFVSQITRMELLAFPALTKREESSIREFLDSVEVVNLGDEVEKLAIEIRRTKGLKLPDAIIVASAKLCGCSLATRDGKIISNCVELGVAHLTWDNT